MEKAYRHWGHDISDEDTPLEAGLGFTVAWDKPGGFIGRDALCRQRENGVRRRLALFSVDRAEPVLYHNEPIWRDGRRVGRTTSAMFGHTVGRQLAMGYIENDGDVVSADWIGAGQYELEVAGARLPAVVSLRPFYDPASRRIKA
jgi:4-methylaminobutanoate oxidase (formaldehyde-forming)